MSSRLHIAGLRHVYGAVTALEHADLTVEDGETLALLGPSGSGKSTLLAAVAGTITPTAGSIRLGGRELIGLPAERRALGMVFQDYALWPHMRVGGNVAFPLRRSGVARPEADRRALAALHRVGLSGFERRRPSQLSGGQQQRVALARAIIAEPALLLLDEPLSALDPDTRSQVRSELADLLGALGMCTVLVTHDREDAFELADRVAVLLDGRIAHVGTPEEVFERPSSGAVARFLGANVLRGAAIDGSLAYVGGQLLTMPVEVQRGPFDFTVNAARVDVVGDADASSARGARAVIVGTLLSQRYSSGAYRLRVDLPGESGSLTVRSRHRVTGDTVNLSIPPSAIHVIGHGGSRADPAEPGHVTARSLPEFLNTPPHS
jgi:ABC-type Fe3+/spermidine/putrescine transport system ATPase subunit